MKLTTGLLFGILVLVSSACTPPGGSTPGPGTGVTPGLDTPVAPTETTGQLTSTVPAETPVTADPLANTQWTLESFGPADSVEPVVEGTTVTLEFAKGSQAGGSGGCNSFGTTYEVLENRISFGEITSTLVLCEGPGVMDQESSYYQALQSAGEFEQAGDRLQIGYENGQGVLNFVRTGPQGTGTPGPSTGLLCSGTGSTTASDWQVCLSQTYGFEVQYPADAELVNQTEGSARIDLPFTPGTNLSEKYLEITATETDETCSSPFTEGYEPGSIPTEAVQVNDLEFIKETGQEGAAGSIYEWVAYSIGKDGLCVSLSFVLRSSNPDVFSTPPPIFDPEAESEIFEEIVETFRWLETSR